MANPAEDNVVQLRPQVVNLVERVANIEDGYARLSNMLLEEYSGADLTKRQFKVLLAVLRLTYGWNKKIDRISNSQIAAIAKLPEKRCSETKLQLVKMNILIQKGNQFGPNKNVSEWDIPQSEVKSLKLGDSDSLKLGDGTPSKQGDTKDIIPKTIKNNKPTHTLQEGEGDNLIFRDELIKLLQGKFNCLTAKDLHSAVEAEILKSGYLCQREYTVADRGDGRRGKIDLYVTNENGAACGIELDHKSPREKSILKLQQLPTGIVMLRETSISDAYNIGGVLVVNANDGEIDKKSVDYYQEFLDAYNQEVGDRLPNARDINSQRKRNFKKLIDNLATPNVDGWRAYVRAFLRMAKPFYFGDNDTGWTADIDHLLKETTLTAVKEGKSSLTGCRQ